MADTSITLDRNTYDAMTTELANLRQRVQQLEQREGQVSEGLMQPQLANRLRRLTANVPAVLYEFLLRPDGAMQFPYVSQGCEDLYEVSADAVMRNADLLFDAIHPDDIEAIQQSIVTSAEALDTWQGQWRVVTASGQEKWLKGFSRPERLADGSTLWYGSVMDITEQKAIESALQASESRLRRLADNVPGMIYEFKMDCTGAFSIPYASSGCAELFGVAAEAAMADVQVIWSLVHPDDRALVEAKIVESAAQLAPLDSTYRILTVDEQLKWVQVLASPQRLADGSTLWSGCLIDASDRIRAQEALQTLNAELEIRVQQRTQDLQASEARFQQMAANVPGMLYQFQITQEGSQEFTYVSDGCRSILGISPESLTRPDQVNTHPDDIDRLQQKIADSAETLSQFRHEWRILTPSGEIKWVQGFSQPERQSDGSIVWTGVLLDVSDRKQAEQELRKLSALVNHSSDFIGLSNLQGELLYVNPAGLEMVGLKSLAEAQAMSILEFLPLSERESFQQEVLPQVMQQGQCQVDLHFRDFRQADGKIPVSQIIFLVQAEEESGMPAFLATIARDIRDQYWAEQALQNHAKLLESIINSTADIIFAKDWDGQYVLVNQVLTDMLGQSQSEIIGKTDAEVFPELADEFVERDRQVMKTRQPYVYEEAISFQGELRNFQTTKSPWYDTQGNIVGIVGVSRDVSDRTQMEKALRDSQHRLALLIRQMPLAAIEWTRDMKVLGWNPAAETIFGFKASEVIGRTDVINLLVPSDVRITVDEVIADLQDGQGGAHSINKNLTKTGRQIVCEWFNTSLISDEGDLVGIVSMAMDISDRYKAQMELADQRQTLRAVLDNAPLGIWMANSEGKMQFVNKTFCESVGISEADFLAANSYADLLPASVAASCRASDWACLAQDGPYNTEELIPFVDGKDHLMEITKVKLQDASGRAVGILGIGVDATDRRRAEAELRASEQRFRDVSETAGEYIWEMTAEGVYTFLTNRVAQVKGHPVEALIGHTPFEFMPPEEVEPISAIVQNAVVMRQPFRLEHRDIAANGEILWEEVTGKPIFNEAGELIGLRGVGMSITERKHNEALRQEREEFLRSIYDGVSHSIFVVDIDAEGVFRYVNYNPSAERFSGQTNEEILGRTPIELFGAIEGLEINKRFQRCVDTGRPETFEEYLPCRHGDLWALTTFSPLKNAEGKIYRIIGTAIDITDRKLAETALIRSESHMRAILDAIPDLMFRMNTEGVYLDFTDSKDTPSVMNPHQLIGRRFVDVLPENIAQGISQVLQDALEKPGVQLREQQVIKDDSIYYEELRAVPCGEDEVLFIVRDITDRKRAEADLQNALAEALGLNAILSNLADGLLVTDVDGIVTRHNPALLSLYRLQANGLIGTNCQDLPMPGLADLVLAVQSKPEEVIMAEVVLPQNRVGQAVASSIFKQVNSHESPTWLGTAILIRDITTEREVDRMKTEFISTVSHELRTPLTSVLGFASIIREKLDESILPAIHGIDDRKLTKALRKVETNLDIIVAEAERLTDLINDVLDIAKMEAGKIDWRMEPVQIAEIVDRAVAATSSLFEQNGLAFHLFVAPYLPEVIGDHDRLIQVLINLISNAVKFTEAGSVTCRVDCQDAAHLRVQIIDTGIGIAPEDQPRVFEKFKQVGNTLTDKPKGTGLGLPICKQIIEHHGGQIWVESDGQHGSTFVFTLPIHTQPNTERTSVQVSLDTLVRQLRSHVASSAIPNSQERQVILVVDDEANIRELLHQSLEREGYEVRQAVSGMDALNQVKIHRPDLIVLDVMMPQINGFDVAAVLKNDPTTADIPIIVLSIVEDEARGYRLGIDRYLTKPINTPKLLQEIQSLLAQGASNKRVLVVDRNASTVRTLSQVLQAQGYSVSEAQDGQECILKARSLKPSMIIIDSVLSQQYDLVKTLRFEKGLEHVFFVLLGDQTNDLQNPDRPTSPDPSSSNPSSLNSPASD